MPLGIEIRLAMAHCVCCGQMGGWIKMPLGTKVGLGQGDIVLDGDPTPPKRGHSVQFSAHVRCGQTAGWIKMPLGMEVGFGPADFVLDADPAPPEKKGTTPPNYFWPKSIAAKRLDGSRCHLVLRQASSQATLC